MLGFSITKKNILNIFSNNNSILTNFEMTLQNFATYIYIYILNFQEFGWVVFEQLYADRSTDKCRSRRRQLMIRFYIITKVFKKRMS